MNMDEKFFNNLGWACSDLESFRARTDQVDSIDSTVRYGDPDPDMDSQYQRG